MIFAEFTADTGIEISKNTARKYLNQSGIRSYIAVSKPYLSAMHTDARLDRARSRDADNT